MPIAARAPAGTWIGSRIEQCADTSDVTVEDGRVERWWHLEISAGEVTALRTNARDAFYAGLEQRGANCIATRRSWTDREACVRCEALRMWRRQSIDGSVAPDDQHDQ
jgi:hypothetical protein